MTHLTMYGRGYFNRMRGTVLPPPRQVLRPYPTPQPAQPYPADDVTLQINVIGDALTDAKMEARRRVDAEAADYKLTAVPKTRSEAIKAYMLLMHSAQAERPSSAAFFREAAVEAPYKFRNASIANILYTAVGVTDNTPRTHRVAVDLYDEVKPGVPASTPPKPKAKSKSAGSQKIQVSTEAEPAPTAPGESWRDRLAMLPPWAPWAVGGVVVAAAAWLLLPPAKKAPASEKA